ncbi:MAG: translation initiation factor IF-2 [Chitinispirillaceae bacterium]|nr:translation initiation factor IF-2 [Chitinispirillaceae bacterium]
MAKEKVYKLAQEFKVSSEALVQMLRRMGISVKSHMSTVDESLRDEIKKRFEEERAEIKKEYERKKQMIARAREELIGKPLDEIKEVEEETPVKKEEDLPVISGEPIEEHPKGIEKARQNKISPEAIEIERKDEAPYSKEKKIEERGTKNYRANEYSKTFTTPVIDTIVIEEEKGTERKNKKEKKKGKKREEFFEVDEVELKANIKKTLAKIGARVAKKKYKKESSSQEGKENEEKKILNVAEFVTVNELANMMNVSSADVIAKCLEFGVLATANQRLDFETIEMIADEFGYEAKLMEEYASDEEEETAVDEKNLAPRAPVVTVMGHVDHGKTSLLDYIRKTNVIAKEAGGITQHIAAYEVETPHGSVTFLDTPGHEAFAAMRARGAQITDVIVLVVAADSGVMPQTKEAIDHARAAGVPIVVAINKIDLPTANVDKVKSELAQYNVLVEDYGGQVSCVEISAKKGIGIDKLLEVLALETELLELKADPTGPARGVVIESELDKGKGPIATVLIQKGTLHKGDCFVTGIHYGKVRELFSGRGEPIESAGPSKPVLVLGLSGTPQAGDSFKVVEDEKTAREISAKRRLAQKEREIRQIKTLSLEHLYEQMKAGSIKTLNLIVKGDVDGSVEALSNSLEKLSTEEIKVCVIHKSVGAIKESDINLAKASNAIIIGFHLSPNSKIREIAKREGVEIRAYRIIYEALDDVKKAMEGMLQPEVKEKTIGNLIVRKTFKISKVGTIAGCYVESGLVRRGDKVRIIREDIVIGESKIESLKRVKDDVREVQSGYECGVMLENFSDIRENDRIEVFEEVEVARKLNI